MIYVCYHIASSLNYQTNLDLVLQALLDFGYKNIVVIDQFKRCNVSSDDLIYTSPSSVTIEPKSFVFVSFVHSWMDGLGSLWQALWVAWNRSNLTEAVIW